ncbi:hypothetical protein EPICR_110048 [Candidatus Desulfarcum epimagneticum]|uniref:Uncharacterized protein n=1 Tax=uncultured Desulfobacteraceae bacterium TaxID=218296 RepID=A0A484HEE2_9BACT|nr:hypothetical protein EPICR_110048 [uncultured Desulfobacteraceae bacterium]
MDFFKKMDPVEREIALLEIVQGSIMLEGMHETAEELEKRVAALKEKRKALTPNETRAVHEPPLQPKSTPCRADGWALSPEY